MRATRVGGPGTKLHGVKCSAPFCRRPVDQGEAVVWQATPNQTFRDGRVVTHTACMRVILDDAPADAPVPRNPRARAAAIRQAVEATGDLFPAV
jgi:hypothetical protein